MIERRKFCGDLRGHEGLRLLSQLPGEPFVFGAFTRQLLSENEPYQINTRVWLTELGRALGRPGHAGRHSRH